MYAVEVRVKAEGSNGGKWRLYPIGDLHKEKKGFNEDRLKRYMDIIAADEHGMYVLLGDILDGTLPDHKFFNGGAMRIKDLEHIEEYVAWQLDDCERLLEPLKNRPGVIVCGNHDVRGALRRMGFVKALAARLNAEYGGVECLIRVNTEDQNGRTMVKLVYARHGSGGGMYPGGKVNRFQNTSFSIVPTADIFLQAHVHDAFSRVLNLVDMPLKGPPVIRRRPVALLTAPSFYSGRVQDTIDYDSEKGLPATDEGIIYLEIVNAHRNTGGGRMTRIETTF